VGGVLLGLAIAGLAVAERPKKPARGGSGSAVVTAGSGSDDTTTTTSDDEEAATGSGSAAVLVAPAEPNARLAWLSQKFAAAVAGRPTLAKAKIAFHAVDLASGKEIVSRDADRGMSLASNAKLLTSIAALAGLGGGFRWRTGAFCAPPDDTGTVAGDLYIRGRGDPVLSVDQLDALALELAARGVREIEGRLVVDATYFDTVTEPPHFDEQRNERAAFRAPVASFAVARSAYTVVVMAEPNGAPARVTLEPNVGDYIKLGKVEVTSITTGGTRLRLDPKPKPGGYELELTGSIRGGQGTWDLRRRVDDPARFAGEVFKHSLAKVGIKLHDRTLGFGPTPVSLKPIAIHDIAETVLKTLGAERKATPGPATWADGVAALRLQLAKLGLVTGYKSENGSGLFGSTEVPAKALVNLLIAAHKDYRIGPDLVASLPVGGFDGTLAKRWHGHAVAGRVRAKTGTLDRVSTLAGFIGVDGGHLVAFAILVNDIPAGQRSVARAMVDDMVDSLAAYLDAR
jgi:D-alanyl-D-alanine carboxypeptidase/D-alanyl-D-alanine-endopeptidase (penicillin-binding protein 4)